MRTASQAMTTEDREKVCRAIAAAEAKTSAEIVPVIATASGRYDRAEDVAGLWMSLIALAVTWTFWPHKPHEHGSWGDTPAWTHFAVLAMSVVGGFLVGAIFASRVAWLKRLFTPRTMMRDDVQSRARHVFFDSRIHHTQGRSGLLVYVSLLEHQAVVLADAAIVERLGQGDIDSLCQQLTDALRTGDLTTALCPTIANAGQKLAAILPRQADDSNELPDALVILDTPL